jgi:adenosylcobinamide-GDP ribazoletransferase
MSAMDDLDHQLVRPVMTAFAFLTRLPIRAGTISDRDLGRSVGFFPVVGLVLGLAAAALAYGAAHVFPPTMVAVLMVAGLAAITGGLHLDGLSDLFDGLAGGQGNRERTLTIMRDSRIGAQGAVAVFLLLAAKVAAAATLIEARDFMALAALPVIGRFAVGPSIVLFPYARVEGLGRAFNGEARIPQLVIAGAMTAVVAFALGPSLLIPALAALGVSLVLSVVLKSRLGGLTGDIYGAIIEIAEVTAAFVATLG